MANDYQEYKITKTSYGKTKEFIIQRRDTYEKICIAPADTKFEGFGYRNFKDEPKEIYSNHSQIRLDDETLIDIAENALLIYEHGFKDGKVYKLKEIKNALEIK